MANTEEGFGWSLKQGSPSRKALVTCTGSVWIVKRRLRLKINRKSLDAGKIVKKKKKI